MLAHGCPILATFLFLSQIHHEMGAPGPSHLGTRELRTSRHPASVLIGPSVNVFYSLGRLNRARGLWAKIPEDHRCPLPPSERLYCDYIQRVGLPVTKVGRRARVRAAKCWRSRLLTGTRGKLGTTCPRLLQFIRDSIPTQHCSGTTKLGGARLTRMKE
jgi:hypothetical protein